MREVFSARDIFTEYYGIEEVASFLGISMKTLKNRISMGKDHPPVIPGAYKFHKDSFAKWLKDQERKQEGSSRSCKAS